MKTKTTKIKMFDGGKEYSRRVDGVGRSIYNSSMQKALSLGDFIKGSEVAKFEVNFAKFMGVKHVLGVGNGTDALRIALNALNLTRGAKVVLPAYNYISAPEVVVLEGFCPVYCSVGWDGMMDWHSLEKILKEEKPEAVIVTHLFGSMANTKEISRLTKKYGVKLIEDNAQSVGRIGYKLYGDIGTTSFYPTKTLGCFGDGGAVYTNKSWYAKQMRVFADHGQTKPYQHVVYGINSRLDNIQASVLNKKLKFLSEDVAKRRYNAHLYDMTLGGVVRMKYLILDSFACAYHQYVVLCNSGRERNRLQKYLAEKGIETKVYYPYTFGDCTIAKSLSSRTLALPVNPNVTTNEICTVSKTICMFYKQNSV